MKVFGETWTLCLDEAVVEGQVLAPCFRQPEGVDLGSYFGGDGEGVRGAVLGGEACV